MDKSRRDGLITASLALGMVVAFWFGLMVPQNRQLAEARSTRQTLETQLSTTGARLDEALRVQEELHALQEHLATYHTRIPSRPNLGGFIKRVSGLAHRLHLADQNIQPRPPERRGALMALPIKIRFTASFKTAVDFLRRRESRPTRSSTAGPWAWAIASEATWWRRSPPARFCCGMNKTKRSFYG